jgi:hypothetical protein
MTEIVVDAGAATRDRQERPTPTPMPTEWEMTMGARARVRLAGLDALLVKLTTMVDRMEEEGDGSDGQYQLDVEAYGVLADILPEVDLTGLELWNDTGFQGKIGGSIFVEDWRVVWFTEGELEPNAELTVTMAHSWLRKPESEIECDGTAERWRCTIEALRWALEKNGRERWPDELPWRRPHGVCGSHERRALSG